MRRNKQCKPKSAIEIGPNDNSDADELLSLNADANAGMRE